MKYSPLVYAALVPMLAVAGGGSLKEKVDPQKLQGDVPVSDVIGSEVKSNDGQQVGDVEDVVLDRNGKVMAVLVSSEGDGAGGGESGARVDDVSAEGGATSDMGAGETEAGAQAGGDTRSVEWSNVSYNAEDGSLQLTSTGALAQSGASSSGASGQSSGMSGATTAGGETGAGASGTTVADTESGSASAGGSAGAGGSTSAGGMQSGSQAGTMTASGGDSIRASELVGMDVNLSDADSFGAVEEVLIDAENGEASAIVVDAWEGFDKQRFALPVELEQVDLEAGELTYAYSESEVSELEEFELQQ